MNSENFVTIVKQVVENTTIEDVIKNLNYLSGKTKDHRLAYLNDWYNNLDENDKECLEQVVKETASCSLFGIFCVLDGVRSIESGTDKGLLELFYVKNGNRTLLNNSNNDFLHDIYRSM